VLRSRPAALAALLLSLPLLSAAAPDRPPPPQGGVIEGRVTMERRAPRRVASRYPGAGGGAAHRQERVPAVAYLVGPVAGARGGGPERPRLVQQDTSFRPAVLVVPVGTAVEFPNRDPFFHNVFSYSAPRRFDLGRYPRGESRSVTFDRPGVVKVYCEIHQWMRSAVLVVQNPYHAEVAEDGRFRISGVPPGRYRLAVWDFDRGTRTVDVAVPAAGSARVEVRM
jgi:plastocyanin